MLGVGYAAAGALSASTRSSRAQAAGDNPWGATGLEWTTQSPPLPENFPDQPVVTEGRYDYSKREIKVA